MTQDVERRHQTRSKRQCTRMQRGYADARRAPCCKMHPTAFIDASPVHTEQSQMKPMKAKRFSVTFKNAKSKQFVARFALKDVKKSIKRSLKTILPVVVVLGQHHRTPTVAG